jgi:aminoglycoside/choline kinase family phosphotransferase
MTNQPAGSYNHLPEPVRTYLEQTGHLARNVLVVTLAGDASTRQYLRVIDRGTSLFVIALYPEPFVLTDLPFANVTELLQQMSVPVPAILDAAGPLGILALEDLGDITLQAHLGTGSPAERAALYRQAVALIETMQRRGAELASPRYTPYGVAFDVDKLTWELEYFVRHFLVNFRGAVIDDDARHALRAEWKPIVEELAAEPRVFCHRDYHSRNLMLHGGRLVVIDYQDARMGPDTYDLVSLLRDSYVDHRNEAVDELIAYFVALKGRDTVMTPAARAAWESDFRRRFDLMSLQRNLKALGTFGYQTAVRRTGMYLQYIPRTVQYVRRNLEKYPRFAALRRLLARYLPELG